MFGGVGMLFDTHVHLNARQFMEDRDEVIKRAYKAEVKNMVVVGFNDETIPLAIEIAEEHENIYAAVGWHPVDAINYTDSHFDYLKQMSEHEKVVALDRKSTRLNSSHVAISYAVFC